MTYKKQKNSIIAILRCINNFIKNEFIEFIIINNFVFIKNVFNKNQFE